MAGGNEPPLTLLGILPMLAAHAAAQHAQNTCTCEDSCPAAAEDIVAFCEGVLAKLNSSSDANGTTTPFEEQDWISDFPHGKPPLLQAHVCCMWFAGPMWFATAVVTAFGRYTSWWLQIHIALALSTLTITAVGIACIVLHVDIEGSGHFRTHHHIVGFVLGGLLVLHILLGAARPKEPMRRDTYGRADDPDMSSARKIWHGLHMVTGFPVLGSLFMYQILYSGHVTLHGAWAFPLNGLLMFPVVILKLKLEGGEAELREYAEEAGEEALKENPVADQGMPPGDELVVCPDITANIQGLYANRQTGKLSPLILLALFSCATFLPHNVLGLFWLPSLIEAYEAGDPLMCFGALFMTVFTCVAVPLWLLETRRTINPVIAGGPGFLAQLGVGRMLLTPRQARSIRRSDHFHPTNPKAAPPNLLPPIIVSLLVLYSGSGARSEPWMNKASALIFAFFMVVARPLVGAFMVTLSVATKLASFQVAAVAKAINGFPSSAPSNEGHIDSKDGGESVDWEQWEVTVVNPIKELVRTMQILTDGWGQGMATVSFASVCMLLGQVCIALSPMTDTLRYFGQDTPLYLRLVNVVRAVSVLRTAPVFCASRSLERMPRCHDVVMNILFLHGYDSAVYAHCYCCRHCRRWLLFAAVLHFLLLAHPLYPGVRPSQSLDSVR
eukprot:COSAG05_NODE_2269_length_3305_cov_2.365876_3_plen_668_part_00